MMRKKKTAKETVAEVIAKVDEEIKAEKKVEAAPVKETPASNHYYRCNVTLGNDKPCNCSAFL